MRYGPKRDIVYGIAIWSNQLVIIIFWFLFFSKAMMIVWLISFLLTLWIWNSTEYRIIDGELRIKCWLFRKRVKIQDILSIKRTNNIYSSFALSTDRLEIIDKSDKYYVAPLDFENFINEMKKNNSSIIVE